MSEHGYDLLEKQADRLRHSKKKWASEEKPVYTTDTVKRLLNHLRSRDSRHFTDYDVKTAVDGMGMRDDEERFFQENVHRRGKRNFITESGVMDILKYHKSRLKEYNEDEIPGTLKLLLGVII